MVTPLGPTKAAALEDTSTDELTGAGPVVNRAVAVVPTLTCPDL